MMNKNICALFIGACLSVVCSFQAGIEQDSTAFRHFENAKKIFQLEKADKDDIASAKSACEEAIRLFEQSRQMDNWLDAKRIQSRIIDEYDDRPFDALDSLERAEKTVWAKPATENEYKKHFRFLLQKSYLLKRIGDFRQVKAVLLDAQQIFDNKLGSRDSLSAGYIFLELGNAYVRLGDYESAKQTFEAGIRYAIAHASPFVAKFNDYGSIYLSRSQFDDALVIFQRGLDFPGLPVADVVLLHLNKAECLARMDSVHLALEINRYAERLMIDSLSVANERYSRCLFGLYENYGIIYDRLGQKGDKGKFAESLRWYNKAVLLVSEAREKSGFHISIADVKFHAGNYKEALDLYHQAIRTVLFEPNLTVGSTLPDSLLKAEKMLVRALEGKARAFRALGLPDKALACYELIPLVEAKLRATHAYESSSLHALKESRERFDEAIAIAWQLYETSNHDRQYAERAFLLSEKARGILLLQSLVRAQADYALPADVRKKENDLRVKMAWYDHEIANEKEKGTTGNINHLKQLEKELFQLKQEQDGFKNFLRDSFPDYARLTGEVGFLTVGDVASLLRADQAIVSFYLTRTDAYVFYFDATGMFTWRKATLPETFRDMTKGYADYLYKGNENDKTGRQNFLRVASLLHDTLLAPELRSASPGIQSLLIIPDGALVFIPFETLLREFADANWRNLYWLLRDYNIGYAYSATLLKMQQEISRRHRQETAPRHVMGGFAPSYPGERGDTRDNSLPNNYPLPDIKSTQDELRKVRKLTGGEAFFKKNATEKQFRQIAAECRTLLLAMHGFANDEHPELSCLMFGVPNKDSSINNNVLYASELQIMQLHADLVVMSACHTGFGKLQQGEGVYSLARAFAAAGVPCTVMSLWRLHENPAPLLVEAFFRHLKAGKTKDEALRLAKLEFLDDDKNGEMLHPFYWASLMTSGDMCALDLPDAPPTPWWPLALGCALLLSVLYWFWRRKRGNRF